MRIPVTGLTEVGIVRDVQDYLLPPNAWTDARNVRMIDGKLIRTTGQTPVLDPPSIAPYWLLHCYDASKNSHWLYAGLTKVYDVSSSVHTEITKAATTYGATADGLWNGGVLGGLPIINNGVDKPQLWSPVSAAQKLVDLTNWPATHTAKIVRPFKNFLFALDITEGGTRYIHKMRISHPADPGAVPSSWDDTDPTKDVYTQELSDALSGGLLDCAPLGDVNVLYKERSTWGAQFIGGIFKWRLFPMFETSGILDDHCVTVFDEGRQHFVATGEDVLVHNGQQRQSIVDKKTKKWLRANISASNYNRSFCCYDEEQSECWFCFPVEGSSWPNLALVWSTIDGSTTLRELDQASFVALGQIPATTSDTWDADLNSWDSDTTDWDIFAHKVFIRQMLQAQPTSVKLLHLDTTQQFSGTSFYAYIERTGLSMSGLTARGQILQDQQQKKLIRGVYIEASGAPFDVQVAMQSRRDGSVTWSAPKTFTPGVDDKVDFTVNAELYGVRFSSTANASWAINKYEVDVELLGIY